jgi:hypothetical protein
MSQARKPQSTPRPPLWAVIIFSAARLKNVREIVFHVFSSHILLSGGRNDDHGRCLLFDTPLDLIGRHINQAVFRTTFHIGTR